MKPFCVGNRMACAASSAVPAVPAEAVPISALASSDKLTSVQYPRSYCRYGRATSPVGRPGLRAFNGEHSQQVLLERGLDEAEI
jgi:hypothetical protein